MIAIGIILLLSSVICAGCSGCVEIEIGSQGGWRNNKIGNIVEKLLFFNALVLSAIGVLLITS